MPSKVTGTRAKNESVGWRVWGGCLWGNETPVGGRRGLEGYESVSDEGDEERLLERCVDGGETSVAGRRYVVSKISEARRGGVDSNTEQGDEEEPFECHPDGVKTSMGGRRYVVSR